MKQNLLYAKVKRNRVFSSTLLLLFTLTAFSPSIKLSRDAKQGMPVNAAVLNIGSTSPADWVKIKLPVNVADNYVAGTLLNNTNNAVRSYFAAPAQPANPSPSNGGGTSGLNPTLCTTVSDTDGDNLRVRFYGRRKPTGTNAQKFTVIILPDTQFYTEQPQGNTSGANNFMFKAQTNWIAGNRAPMNIVYVGHLGDCVQNGDNAPGADNDIEWRRVDTAMKTIESQPLTGLAEGIPYGLTVGNHDQTPFGSATGTTTFYNQYFGSARFNGRTYYGGHNASNNDNHYQLFSASGIDFLVISLEYDQTAGFSASGGALDWAEGLVQTHNNRKVIVMTHFGINENTTFGTQGQAIYTRLRQYPNFALYMCGHIHTTDGEARRSDTFNGNTVHTLLSDYQSRTGGGSGKLRIYEFDPVLNKLSAQTYSPFNNTFETDADSQFQLDMNLNPYTLIGEVNNVTSGADACMNWTSLTQTTEYEWFAESFDGTATTTGPVWSFTTPSDAELPLSLINFDALPESKGKVKVSWTTTFEQGNKHFEVQRSKDGVHFEYVATVAANGNSNNNIYYKMYDNDPFGGVSYYRLKLVESDNSFTYSGIARVNRGDVAGTASIFPNPVNGNKFTMRFDSNIQGKVLLKVFDMTGKMHWQKQVMVANRRVEVQHRLPAGTYIVHISSDAINEKKQIVISK